MKKSDLKTIKKLAQDADRYGKRGGNLFTYWDKLSKLHGYCTPEVILELIKNGENKK